MGARAAWCALLLVLPALAAGCAPDARAPGSGVGGGTGGSLGSAGGGGGGSGSGGRVGASGGRTGGGLGGSGGTGAGGASGGTGGAGGSCAAGLAVCGGACADLTSDASHCGGCDRACAAGEGCMQSACRALPTDCRQQACPSGYYCDLGSGACKSGCAVDADCAARPGRTCTAATHQCDCQRGTHDCGGACVSSTAVATCGASCGACPTDPNGSATCDGVSCGVACSAGYIWCGGACIACGDAHGTGACVAGACSLTCQSSYNACGARCATPSDATACGPSCTVCAASGTNVAPACVQNFCSMQCAAGTAMCKGQCGSGSCSWTAHTAAGTVAFFNLDVDGDGVTHAATTYKFNPSYLRVAGAGAPVAEVVDSQQRCWENTGSPSSDTRPIVMVDGSGKASVICVSSIDIVQFTWNGTAWTSRAITTGSGLSAGVFHLTRTGNRMAWRYTNGTDDYFEYGELAGGAWTVKLINNQIPSLIDVLGGAAGAAQIGWVSTTLTQTLQVVTQTSTGFTTPQMVPHVADVYALDGFGRLIGVKKDLTVHIYNGGVWGTSYIGSTSLLTPATAIDLVVDGAGVLRVAWSDGAGVHLATLLGFTWFTELVSATTAQDIDLAVGPTGKVAIGIRTTTSSFVIFD
jgi:hypothetical protein